MQALLFSSHPEEEAILTIVLQQAGFNVRSLIEFERAMEVWPERPADLIMMAIDQESSTKIKEIKQIRAHTAVPIIAIMDIVREEEGVNLVEAGVDLVVPRPYSVRLLVAHIKSMIRRSAGVPYFSLPTMTQSGIKLDPGTRTVEVEGKGMNRLTQLEFRLLYTLMTHAGQIIPTENLVEHVWGYPGEGNRELVRGLVQRLRIKVEPDPRNPKYIRTEPGIGYYFDRNEIE